MNYRSFLIRLVTFLGGIYFFLEFVLPSELPGDIQFGKYHTEISRGFILVGAMALGLGIINLLLVHGSKIAFQKKGWPNSFALLFGLFLMMFVTTADWLGELRISRTLAEINVLREFSQLIRKDNLDQIVDHQGTAERNRLLQEALKEKLARITKRVDALEPGLRQEWERDRFVSYKELTSEMVQRVYLLNEGLAIDADMLKTQPETGQALDANLALEAAASELTQAYREVLRMNYQHSLQRRSYNLLFHGLFVALGSAMFSLLAFYIAAAAYRAFRVKSMESTLMMLAAFAVMLGQIPFGVWIWEGLTELRLWIMVTPNSAASRAIKIGAAIAGLVMAFRMWLSIESRSFAERGDK
jgi:hypothetical protein